ncbi:MAG: glycosyltransferase [Selenomonadaceae bacterium]|nr:glycosyltransferase [Selenomonadaceae bacterium]
MSKRKPNPEKKSVVVKNTSPAVSVIIPMYNAEKYIADCLDSILRQTFQDFEVIVVDDCSTDSSHDIVKSYGEKFGGRLKLSSMNKNCGSGSLPRNKGLIISRGEYIYNMDNDDAIIPTALETMYNLAKEYDADVVYCEKFYGADSQLKNLYLTSRQPNKTFVDKPTLEPDSLAERTEKILKQFYWTPPWSKLIRRDLLVENEITLPNIIADDTLWTWDLLLSAKRFLRVPNAVYV